MKYFEKKDWATLVSCVLGGVFGILLCAEVVYHVFIR